MDYGGNETDLLSVNSSLVAAAHELKSPLALVRQLSLFLDETDDLVEAKQIAAEITEATERALKLVINATKAARLEDALFEMMPVNPVQVCDEVWRGVGHANRRLVSRKYQSKRRLVVANRELLGSILAGLLDNAVHYGDSYAHPEIFVNSHGEKVRIGVRDYGPALPTNVWRSIKAGRSATQRISNRPTSSGLGLMIAEKFAEAMNSHLGVVQHKDGVSFYLELPVSRQLSLL